MTTDDHHTILIASYLEPDLVERLKGVDRRLEVLYEPGLLQPPRYPGDHKGESSPRSDQQESQWRELLGRADILFDFDPTHREDLPELAPQVRWIQATSSGIGQFVKRYRYAERMPETIFTTARGVHAQPLAEFCLMAMLTFVKDLRRIQDDQRSRTWARYATTDLEDRTLGVIGLGKVGAEVARLGRAFRMHVIGTKRDITDVSPDDVHVDELFAPSELERVIERSEFLVLAAPHTDETESLLGARELAMLPQGAVVINVGRGALIDEPALVEALASGRLRGAALDVFATEPLPEDSRLWEMPNVLVSPHSASTSDRENRRITDLFSENIRRYLADEPMLNVLERGRLY